MKEEFSPWWKSQFGSIPPIGYRLRIALPDRWLRTHSLPEAKRYAESPSEYGEILRRYLAVAAEVLGELTPWVVAFHWESDGSGFSEFFDVPLELVLTVPIEDEPEAPPVDLFAGRSTPTESALRAIAGDQLRALWVNGSTSEIFAPYDGGADLILKSPERVRQLRPKFLDWLSPLESGL